MDYTWDGIKGGGTSPYEKGKYMPILRNHRYIFTIKEVKGPGFATLNEAVTSPDNFTNHNIVVVPIVIDAFTDITFNESGHFLAVTRTAMTLQGKHDATSTQNKFSVRTNYPSGWKVGAYNADGTTISVSNSWLKPSQNSGAAGATLTNPVTEELQAITNGKGFKDGYLEIRAGRLYTKINIKQIGTPLDYVAEYNLAGGSIYNSPFISSVPPGISPTAAQTDPNLHWASSHSNDQSGYYNWYVLTGENNDTYNPNAKKLFDDVFFKLGHPGYGYHLPSRWELTGVFSYSGNTQYDSPTNTSNVNEAIEFGGIKKTFANDYFSSGNGVCYALRFKQGTGNPIDDSSLSDFPLATDNNMVCAYRYTRVGSFANHDFTSLLKVDCVYLGSAFTGNISTINNDSWWDSHTSEAVVRIFPAAGYISFPTFISSGLLEARGEYGRYWSSREFPSLLGNAWNVSFYSYSAFANYRDVKHHGFSVRLFADK